MEGEDEEATVETDDGVGGGDEDAAEDSDSGVAEQVMMYTVFRMNNMNVITVL